MASEKSSCIGDRGHSMSLPPLQVYERRTLKRLSPFSLGNSLSLSAKIPGSSLLRNLELFTESFGNEFQVPESAILGGPCTKSGHQGNIERANLAYPAPLNLQQRLYGVMSLCCGRCTELRPTTMTALRAIFYFIIVPICLKSPVPQHKLGHQIFS